MLLMCRNVIISLGWTTTNENRQTQLLLYNKRKRILDINPTLHPDLSIFSISSPCKAEESLDKIMIYLTQTSLSRNQVLLERPSTQLASAHCLEPSTTKKHGTFDSLTSITTAKPQKIHTGKFHPSHLWYIRRFYFLWS